LQGASAFTVVVEADGTRRFNLAIEVPIESVYTLEEKATP